MTLETRTLSEECVDAVVLFDGGSDSLMRGDEHGVGDLTEDAVRAADAAAAAAAAACPYISFAAGECSRSRSPPPLHPKGASQPPHTLIHTRAHNQNTVLKRVR